MDSFLSAQKLIWSSFKSYETSYIDMNLERSHNQTENIYRSIFSQLKLIGRNIFGPGPKSYHRLFYLYRNSSHNIHAQLEKKSSLSVFSFSSSESLSCHTPIADHIMNAFQIKAHIRTIDSLFMLSSYLTAGR